MSHRPDLLDSLLPPRLHSNGIAVWVLGPKAVATVLCSQESLSSAELVRAAKIARTDKRSEFIAAQRALRLFLAQQSGDEPSHIEFNQVSGPLQPVGHYRDLTCSLAHRHGRIALAICATGPIGIDMEQVMAHRADSLSSDLLHGLPVGMVQTKPVQLFAAWCELEALSKMQKVDLPVLLPQWRKLCQAAGLPTVMPKVRHIMDIRLSHWEPYPSWRLVLASKDLISINIKVDD